ncbi:protein odr-4 homolog [Dreissena polymorpha]|uniref:Protein odr-4 homolog n=1 Tax=Dreissena polymorpha TaxID=45954 RepID=A0A9D4FGW1_DREPO|nr:protein odr-4 homolog [Dreissena polymorpha]KAH3798653.1 hypothetical protein DPMN_152255 [Dreissena polymorpha]
MGRTILADDRIQAYVDKLLSSNTWFLGTIIGKLTNQKDYAVHIVKTPEPLEDSASVDQEPEEGSQNPRQKSQTRPAELADIKEQWAATHAKQVSMMLPGGLDIIGIFAVAPPAMMQAAQVKLRQILFAIQKQEKKSSVADLGHDIGERILLQICSTTRKYTCRTIDVQDPKSAFRPAEWRSQSTGERWLRLEAELALNIPIYVSSKMKGTNLAKQIQTGLQPYFKSVCTSLMLVDNTLRQEMEILDQSTDRKGKSKDISANQSSYSCNIFLKHPSSPDTTEPSVIDCTTQLVIKGKIHGRAYVIGKATVKDAQNTMRTDIIRSIQSRCELLSDDIQVVEDDIETHEVYSTPRRVFFQLPGSSLQLCDYMFQDEKFTEVRGRVQELLDLTLEEEDLDLSFERPATEEDCCELSVAPGQSSAASAEVTKSNQGVTYYIMAGVGGALALAAAVVSYLNTPDT